MKLNRLPARRPHLKEVQSSKRSAMKTMPLAASHDAFLFHLSSRRSRNTRPSRDIHAQCQRGRRAFATVSSSSSSKGTAAFTSSAAADGDGGGKKGKSGAAFMTQTVSDYEAKQRAISASKWIYHWKQNFGPISFDLI